MKRTRRSSEGGKTNLDESGTTVEIEMQVLDLAELPESIVQVFLLCFLMDSGHQYDPSLNCYTHVLTEVESIITHSQFSN
jgi:hypothetical protein